MYFVSSPATSLQFGFVGGGTLFLLHLNENGTINETKSFEWSDALFDIVSIFVDISVLCVFDVCSVCSVIR